MSCLHRLAVYAAVELLISLCKW